MLNPEIFREVLMGQNPIRTKIADNPPTKLGPRAQVANSLISSGCIIEGEIRNSIISRDVIVEAGAKVNNSIVMQKCRISENAYLDCVILDKFVKVHAGNVLKGNMNFPLAIRKGTLV